MPSNDFLISRNSKELPAYCNQDMFCLFILTSVSKFSFSRLREISKRGKIITFNNKKYQLNLKKN